MRIGVYLGHWSLEELGGMGVYLRSLLHGVESLRRDKHELMLLVDEANVAAARALELSAEVVLLKRPQWHDLSVGERRAVIGVRRLSYRSLEQADALRSLDWSTDADRYLWGVDDASARCGMDLLYFTLPPYLKRPVVPVVLTVHDLKHVHRPQDHDRADLARRRRWGRVARAASMVYASYEHIRRDIEEHFGVVREKTAVVPLACPVGRFVAAAPVSLGIDLPERFALMPAQLWPHKNHERVVRAVAHLRKAKKLDVTVLCTGQTEGQCAEHAERIGRLAKQLGVDDLIRCVGFVPRKVLLALYGRARLVLVASLYEPGSFPAMEAMALGKPLAASRITSIPETVGDAALYFDPTNVRDMAEVLGRLWTDDALCRALAVRGPKGIGDRTWADVGRDWLELCARAVSAPVGVGVEGMR